jgi:anti-sigma B factor antagonist
VPAPNEFDVTTESAGEDALVVRVSGDLDLATSSRFSEVLAAAPVGRHVVIDLTDCSFLDSSGVRALVQAARKIPADERRVHVVAGSPAILRVLEITGVDRMVPVHRSLEDAL